MPLLAILIFLIYVLALAYITVYCLMQFDLVIQYLRGEGPRKQAEGHGLAGPPPRRRYARLAEAGMSGVQTNPMGLAHRAEQEEVEDVPMVTVQLPIFNEKYVVERLLDHVAALAYPRHRLEVQVLDDSTDETLDISRRRVAHYVERGYDMKVVRRSHREGYKAGALRDALPRARGSYIVIFDADFMPRPDFLQRTLPHFRDERVGVVQTRWEHINESYSLLTRLQALQLNVHFSVEQAGRMQGQYLLQFNGTAGVWRRRAIEEAGGWSADTLTEDLDLSVRAQLRGWRIRYLEEVGTPAELPVDMPGLKSQQFRWMKGGAETARKLLPVVWRSGLPWWTRLQATFHLLASTIFTVILLAGLSSLPLAFMLDDLRPLGIDRDVFIYFLVGLLSIAGVYAVGNVRAPFLTGSTGQRLLRFAWRFPVFLSLSMGLSLHNSWAVLQGYLGKRSPFVRTPKYAIEGSGESFRAKAYRLRSISWITFLEGLLALVFAAAAIAGLWRHQATFSGFHLMLAFGFGAICYYSLRHAPDR